MPGSAFYGISNLQHLSSGEYMGPRIRLSKDLVQLCLIVFFLGCQFSNASMLFIKPKDIFLTGFFVAAISSTNS